MEFTLRVRMGSGDAHYGGNLVDGAKVMGLFGDAATGLLILADGDEGLFVAYDDVQFKAPVYAGDFLEVTATMEKIGNTSRTMSFRAFKIIAANDEVSDSAADKLEPPQLVVSAKGVCVVPKDKQRRVV